MASPSSDSPQTIVQAIEHLVERHRKLTTMAENTQERQTEANAILTESLRINEYLTTHPFPVVSKVCTGKEIWAVLQFNPE